MQGFKLRPANTYNTSASTADLPKSYAEAEARYAQWHDNPRRRTSECKLDNNTFLEATSRPHDGATVYAVRLHRTRVVTFNPDGSVTLSTGGWQTPTTRDRFNRCGARVSMAGGIASVFHGGREYTYLDTMDLRPDGTVAYFGEDKVREPAEARKLRRRNLARFQRYLKSDKGACEVPWQWPTRSGGYCPRGNAPEAEVR